MPRTRFIVAALAALALAAPAASADPHAIDSHNRAVQAQQDARAELNARSRDGVQTGSLAGTTDEIAHSLATERAYATYGEPAPIEHAPPSAPITADDGTPWVLVAAGFAGVALLFGLAVLLVARPRRARVAT
jgi:hypothetical protein